jgi:hypothetical protein
MSVHSAPLTSTTSSEEGFIDSNARRVSGIITARSH